MKTERVPISNPLSSAYLNAVVIEHADGTTTPYPAASSSAAHKGTAFKSAIAATVSGDVIRLGAGTFNVGTTQVAFPAGVTVRGSGKYTTTLTSDATGVTAAFVMDDGVEVYDLTINWSGQNKFVGFVANATVRFYNCYVSGYSDCILVNIDGVSVYLYDCDAYATSDTFQVGSATNLVWEAYNCRFTSEYYATYPAATQKVFVTGVTQTIKLYGCKLTAVSTKPTTANVWGVYVAGQAGDEFHCYGCVFDVSRTAAGGSVYDVYNDGAGDIILGDCIGSGVRGKVLSIGSVQDQSNRASEILFIDHFLGKAVSATFWSVTANKAGSQPTAGVADGSGGRLSLALSSTNEIQCQPLDCQDKLNYGLADGLIFEARCRFTVLPPAGVVVGIGMCGIFDPAMDSVAQAIWFKCDGSAAVVVESDDGTPGHEKDDISTGITLTQNQWYTFTIDMSDPTSCKFYIDDVWVATTTTFDMSADLTLLIQPVCRVGKEAASTAVCTMQVDRVEIRQTLATT